MLLQETIEKTDTSGKLLPEMVGLLVGKGLLMCTTRMWISQGLGFGMLCDQLMLKNNFEPPIKTCFVAVLDSYLPEPAEQPSAPQ